MNHRGGVLAVVLLGLLGCTQPQTRLQSDEEPEKDPLAEVKTIGDVTSVANAEPVAVSGVGLVVGLHGTGGGAPPGDLRTVLENELRKDKIENPKAVVDSTDNALVLVTALIPAGAHKNDPLDVEVVLPPQSKATSLRGGVLRKCVLCNYDTTRNLSPSTERANRWVQGHALAEASGSLLVGFGDGDEAATLKRGRIWGGGKSRIDRPFYLTLNADQQYARVAMQVAKRINETFQGPFRGTGSDLAKAQDKNVVYLNVPAQYKHNLPRYLRVVRLIPLQEALAGNSGYRKRLEENLLDPARTVTAALRLEALGTETTPLLKRGLQSEACLVRFSSAEALAYLGSPSCGEELAKLVRDQPVLRAYCLTALASLDEAICHVQLRELLQSPSAETRDGAFRALRALDERDDCVRGEQYNESFWLHRVAPGSEPMVHISTSRRPEIVLFGEDVFLQPPFTCLAGPEFTVTASRDSETCSVRRISVKGVSDPRQCSLKLADVLQTVADLGGEYPDVVELLRQADRCQALTCRVLVDALPEATSIYDLARAGQKGKDSQGDELLRTDAEVLKARADFGATPTLFDDSHRRRAQRHSDEDEGASGG